MAIKLRTRKPDPVLQQIVAALKPYVKANPGAEIELYRQNNVSVRVRIIDPSFKGRSWVEREQEVWGLLDALPSDVVGDVSLLLLLTPEETSESLANLEFEHPSKSQL
jgi:hypothetical protein